MSVTDVTPGAVPVEDSTDATQRIVPISRNTTRRAKGRNNYRPGNAQQSTPKDFESATPKIGSNLDVRSESMRKK